ncbi:MULTISPECIES: OsmC family protein [unclassified Acidovorax]|uniref:OsmC family protein n=1 Tax=unclassified Acidovorax TaxID=2684926 RepID=UPI002882F560|nr:MULTISPECIES: OsmC family protein [unclassified Acidovorax]
MSANLNGIDVVGLKSFVSAVKDDPKKGIAQFSVNTNWEGQTRTVATTSEYVLGGQKHQRHFEIAADEPGELLGKNSAPNPQEVLMAALNACMSVGYVANAAAMGIAIEKLQITTEGELDLRGFLGLDANVKPGYEQVRYTVTLRTNAPKEKVQELHELVMRTSPNFSNFASPIKMIPTLVVEAA